MLHIICTHTSGLWQLLCAPTTAVPTIITTITQSLAKIIVATATIPAMKQTPVDNELNCWKIIFLLHRVSERVSANKI